MKISAVLLAGGESRRMDQDKATLEFHGKHLWRVQLDLLRRLQPVETFVSARTDPPWRPPDTQFLADDPPSRGPLSGLTAALKRTRTSHLLALAIDMPFMTDDCLRRICDFVESGRGVLPIIDSRAEPLAAIYPVEVCSDFYDALSGDDFSLQSLTKALVAAGKLRAMPVSKDDEHFYRNVNQLSDLMAEPQ
jgi:molybdopterin-guanine dinucleotide biosynthesis protein A